MRHEFRIKTFFAPIRGKALDERYDENTSSRITYHITMISREKHLLNVVILVKLHYLSYVLLEEGWLELASTFVYCYSMSEKFGSALTIDGTENAAKKKTESISHAQIVSNGENDKV